MFRKQQVVGSIPTGGSTLFPRTQPSLLQGAHMDIRLDGGRAERPHVGPLEQYPATVRGGGACRRLPLRSLLHRTAAGLAGAVPLLHHGSAADTADPVRAAGVASHIPAARQRRAHGRAARPAQRGPLRHGSRRRVERVGARRLRRPLPARRRAAQPPRGGHPRHARSVGAGPRHVRGPLLHPYGRRLPAPSRPRDAPRSSSAAVASGAPCASPPSTPTSGTASA